jgi:hypothetical protein
MGCLSSAQASPPVVTIQERQQTTSSLPSKHSVPRDHREQSWSLKEPSEEEIRAPPQRETKREVLVLQTEKSPKEDTDSQPSLSLYVEKKTEEEFTLNDKGTKGTDEKDPPLESHEPEQKFTASDKVHVSPSVVNEQRQFTEDAKIGGNSKSIPPMSIEVNTTYKDSDDADSGFENPEIASVSAFSPDDPSDDEMF